MLVGVTWTTLVDFPGEVAATMFFHGCNLRCGFCHNHELVTQEPGERISRDLVRKGLERRRGFLTGVAFTGGEPLLSEELVPLAQLARQLGYRTKLDTNGTLPDLLAESLQYFDYVAMDIKAPEHLYPKAAGVDVNFDSVRESVRILMDSGIPYEFRTTLVPGIVDSPEHIHAIGQEIRGANLWALQRFVPESTLDPLFQDLPSITPGEAKKLSEVAIGYVKDTILRI